MGIEVQVLEEFWPITPVRTTHALAKNEEEEDDCVTPTSPSRRLRIPLECPPAPKKPRRIIASTSSVSTNSQRFLFHQIPRDLSSVFFPPPSIPTTTTPSSSKQPLNLMTTLIDS